MIIAPEPPIHTIFCLVARAVLSKTVEPLLVMELMENGSLYDLLHNESMHIEGDIILPILRDIASGIRFLHAADPLIIHGDLKAGKSFVVIFDSISLKSKSTDTISANVLVDGRFRAKVRWGFTSAMFQLTCAMEGCGLWLCFQKTFVCDRNTILDGPRAP
jgi:serine/threonine protein kinase